MTEKKVTNNEDEKVTTEPDKDFPKYKGKASIQDIAVEVNAGKWGKGQDRRRRLSEAGYDPREVQRELVRVLNNPS